MTKRSEGTDVRESGEARPMRNPPGTWVTVAASFGALFVAIVAVGALAASCGEKSGGTSAPASAQVESSAGGTHAVVAAVTPAAPAAPTSGERPVLSGEASDEVLPPDVSLSVLDTLVTPGQVIPFTVEGTTDVSRMELYDGNGDPLPMVRLAGSNTWRVAYRVPLRPRLERYGVSITAYNDANRWRRVWVFLHVRSAAELAEDAVPDSTEREK